MTMYFSIRRRSSFAAVPRRLPVLWGKVVVIGVVGLVVAVPAAFGAFFLGQSILGAGANAALSDDGVRVVRLLAAARRPMPRSVLMATRPSDGRITAKGLAEAIESRLVVEIGGSVAIAHELYAEAIEELELPPERHQLHVTMAKSAQETPALAAWHWEAASRPIEARAAHLEAAAATARSETEAKARPGGVISDFCEPAITTSTPHSSWGRSTAPRPEIASTARIVLWLRATSANARTSLTTPVDVSDWVVNRARTGRSRAPSASSTRSGFTFSPHSNSS